MINILIVDDSETETQLLKNIFLQEPDFNVIGCAKNGKEAIQLTEYLKPDIITMDIQMPVLDGLNATKIIMSKYPTPIVVISSTLKNTQLNMSFQALEAGALSVIEKPVNTTPQSFNDSKDRIIEAVRSMSEIIVIKHRFPRSTLIKHKNKITKNNPGNQFEVLVIGASVGGPQVLSSILTNLPEAFPIPIIVVQHMTPGFMSGFVKWMNNSTTLNVKEATHNEVLSKGTVYFAPDYFHMQIHKDNDKLISKLITAPPVTGFCPSINVLFHSVSTACENSIGVLLTGMGSDGAQGLLDIKEANGHTIIQDEESCVVFGMAGVAQSMGAVDKIVEIGELATYLKSITFT
jgi:two-component system chemotaxis response regulator CheB